MTIVTKGMGAIIKGITKGTKARNSASKKMFKDAVRKVPLKKKKKSLLDITPRKVIKSVAKDVKAATKNKTLLGTGIASGVNEVVKNEKKKKKD
jgi:hypothetical protein|tara:strand:- start:183 stop:464 length:282 start_codon:yes stop_codon:yes gene_type:complete